MTITMNDSHMTSIAQLRAFGKFAQSIAFQASSQKEKYEWITMVLTRFLYTRLSKRDKSTVRAYMQQMTGFSRSQLTRLIKKKKKYRVIIASTKKRHRFPTIYTTDDVARLADTDLAHNRLSGPATKRIFQREYDLYKNEDFVRLRNISVAHLYTLRGRRQYTSKTRYFSKTQSTTVSIGERRKPNPAGRPGYLRVDTVHQGDLEHEKGVYHINLVDEVTQWEIVGAVEKISEAHLVPLLRTLLEQFPFRIIAFHSDNGSEYVNQIVADLLNKLLIHQTKSRAYHCNDNALVEGKNGSIIRKHMGYAHIAQKHAGPITAFYRLYFNPYLNYHRPCAFPTIMTDAKGKRKKLYNTYMTPYERLQSLPDAEGYLKDGTTFAQLDAIAQAQSDNECGALVQKEKQKLFATLRTL
jgi:transposase InsO family protein